METHPNLINGSWHTGTDTNRNVNPSDTSDEVGIFARGTAEDAQAAVAAAAEAAPRWAATTPADRATHLDHIGATLERRKEELGRLLSREEGKTLREGVGEVARAGQIFRYYAAQTLSNAGEILPGLRPGVEIDIQRRPVGVVSVITPWNFPIAIPAWKVAPALAYGNAVVLKPADMVPASAWALAEIIQSSGVPAGVFNLVMGRGSVVGEVLTTAADVDAVSFTGSVETGRSLATTAVEHGKRVQLEMGGKNPLVVLDDADLDVAVRCAVAGSYFSTGQRCTASSRLIVTDGIHDRFVDALVDRLADLHVGHALDEGTDIGPVVDRSQLEQDLRYITLGQGEGATLAFGGATLQRATEGFFLEPTLFVDSTNEMRINREEIFGPVAGVIRVDGYDEALATANDTDFGLSAGIVTTSLKAARDFRHRVQAGMVMVNLPTAGTDHHVPFGGTKASSYGPREQGTYARDFYQVITTGYTAAG